MKAGQDTIMYVLLAAGVAYILYTYFLDRRTGFERMSMDDREDKDVALTSRAVRELEDIQATDALLPSDPDDEWNAMNPQGLGDLSDAANLLPHEFTIGAISESRRGMSLDIRPAPIVERRADNCDLNIPTIAPQIPIDKISPSLNPGFCV